MAGKAKASGKTTTSRAEIRLASCKSVNARCVQQESLVVVVDLIDELGDHAGVSAAESVRPSHRCLAEWRNYANSITTVERVEIFLKVALFDHFTAGIHPLHARDFSIF